NEDAAYGDQPGEGAAHGRPQLGCHRLPSYGRETGLPGPGSVTALAGTAARSELTRRIAGIAISIAFLALTLARIDLPSAGRALSHVAPLALVGALGLSALEVAIRAVRWW